MEDAKRPGLRHRVSTGCRFSRDCGDLSTAGGVSFAPALDDRGCGLVAGTLADGMAALATRTASPRSRSAVMKLNSSIYKPPLLADDEAGTLPGTFWDIVGSIKLTGSSRCTNATLPFTNRAASRALNNTCARQTHSTEMQ